MQQNLIVSIPIPEFVSMIEETIRKVLGEKKLDQDKLLSSAEVMKEFKISTTTLQKWRTDKKIPFISIGKKMFYSKAAILESVKKKVAA